MDAESFYRRMTVFVMLVIVLIALGWTVLAGYIFLQNELHPATVIEACPSPGRK